MRKSLHLFSMLLPMLFTSWLAAAVAPPSVSVSVNCQSGALTAQATATFPSQDPGDITFVWATDASGTNRVGNNLATQIFPNGGAKYWVAADSVGILSAFVPVNAGSTFLPKPLGNGNLWNGLVLAYNFNGQVLDLTKGGNPANNGTIQGTVQYGTDRFGNSGKAGVFSGSSRVSTSIEYATGPQAFTLSAWFRTNAQGGKIMGWGNNQFNTSSRYDRHIFLTNSGNLAFGIYVNNNLGTQLVATNRAYNDNQWHHVAGVFRNQKVILFVDGDKVDSLQSPGPAEGGNGWWKIGTDNTWLQSIQNFVGSIDDAFIFHRALSDAEIAQLRNPNPEITQISNQVCGSVAPAQFKLDYSEFGMNYSFLNQSGGGFSDTLTGNGDELFIETDSVRAQTSLQLKSMNIGGCELLHPTLFQIVAGPEPIAPQANSFISCSGQPLQFKARGANSNATFKWYSSLTASQVLGTDSTFNAIALSPGDSLIFYVSAVETSGCESIRVKQKSSFEASPAGIKFIYPSNGAITQWRIPANATNTLSDASGATPANTGTVNNGSFVNDRFGGIGGAVAFNGISTIVTSSRQFNNPGTFSNGVLFRTQSTTGGVLFAFGSTQGAGTSIQSGRTFYLDNSGRLNFALNFGGAINTNLSYNDGKWHYAFVTWSQAQGPQIFVDGSLAASGATVGTPDNINGWWKLGAENVIGLPNQPSSRFFSGEIDEFVYYNRILTQAEIAAFSNRMGVSSTTLNLCGVANPSAEIKIYNSQIGVNYQLWVDNLPNGNPASGTGDTLTFTTNLNQGQPSVQIQATNIQNGCTNKVDTTFTYRVGAFPAAPQAINSQYCGSSIVQLRASGGSAGAYLWYNSATGGIGTLVDSVLSANVVVPGDSFIRYVSSISPIGCEGPRTKVVGKVYDIPSDLFANSGFPKFNPILAYEFKGSAVDIAPLAPVVNATWSGSANYTTDRLGRANNAIQLNGTNQQLFTTALLGSPNVFSQVGWFRTTTTRGGYLFGLGSSNSAANGSNYDRSVYMANDGRIFFGVYNGGVITTNSGLSFNDGNWHHVAAIVTANRDILIYVDGLLRGQTTFTGNIEAYNAYFRIGNHNLSGWASSPSSTFFNGALDDIAFYNKALTPAEIQVLFKLRGGIDLSNTKICGAGNTITARINMADLGVTYSFIDSLTGQISGTPVTANTDTIDVISSPLNTPTKLVLRASNLTTGCSIDFDSTLNLNLFSAAPNVSVNSVTACGSGAYSLVASGTNNGNYRWYNTSFGGSAIAGETDSVFTSNILFPGDSVIYYVSSITTDGCESPRALGFISVKRAPGNVAPEPTSGLVLSYSLDSSVIDKSSVNPPNNGTRVNTVDTTDRFGKRFGAMYFNGTNSQIQTTTSFVNPQTFTLSVWFKAEAGSQGGRLMGFGNQRTTTSGNYDRQIVMTSNGQIYFGTYLTNEFRANVAQDFRDGNWHHVAGTFQQGQGSRIYIDGVLRASLPNAGAENTTGFWRIGGERAWGANGFFQGFLDEPRVFNRRLTDAQIKFLFEPGVEVKANQTTFCGTTGQTDIFILKSQTGVRYQFKQDGIDAGNPISGNGDTLTFNTGTLLSSSTFSIIATDSASGCFVQLDSTIKINVSPAPAAASGRDTTRCGSGTTLFRASGAPFGSTYRWYTTATGGSPIAVGNNPVSTPTLTSTTLTPTTANPLDSAVRFVSVVNAFGCESATRTRLVVYAGLLPATPTISNSGLVVCGTDSVTLTAPAGFPAYVWRAGTNILPRFSQSIKVGAAGPYSLSVVGLNGCPSNFSAATNVTAGTKPGKPTISVLGANTLQATSTGGTGTTTYIWLRDGIVVTGQVAQNLNNAGNGSYQVIVTRGGCRSDTSDPFIFTSLASNLMGNLVKMYPNPAQNHIEISLTEIKDSEVEVSVLTMDGRQVLNQTLIISQGQLNRLDISYLPKGIYLVLVKTSLGQVPFRLVKE